MIRQSLIHKSVRWLVSAAGAVLLGGMAWTGTQAHPAAQPGAQQVAQQVAAPLVEGTENLPAGAITQTVLSGMINPIAMAFDPQGRLFYTEKTTGAVRLFQSGTLQAAPVITFSVNSSGERGLLGIAIDPDFASNHYIYVYYTCNPAGGACAVTQNQVVRFVENNGTGASPQTIFTSPVSSATNHNGGNIHFGPDGKLYISVGDGGDTPQYSQDVTMKNGKIHRVNPDGTIPAGNPVFTQTGALPSLYVRGLRNTFDFAFDPLTAGRIFASENGPSCDDEMNRIEGGYNYGWRAGYPCDDANPSPTYNTIAPLWSIPAAGPACCLAPTGIQVYTGSSIPQWSGGVFMATYNSGQLRHFYLDGTRTTATAVNIVQGITVNMDIETGPDGALWYIQGGGYSAGTLMRIVGTGGTPTVTSTGTPPTGTVTPTRTVTASPTATVPVTGSPTETPGYTVTPPTPLPTNTACAVSFSDVPSGSTFYTYVQCLACRGILGGYSDGTFRPGNNVTRGQLAKIVANAAGWAETVSGQTFSDVTPGSTFYDFVERMASRGYIGGYACGGTNPQTGQAETCDGSNRPYFRPNNSSSRGQIAKIVAQSAQLATSAGAQRYADVPPGSTFYLWINQLTDAGAVTGYACGGTGEPCIGPTNLPYFRPSATTTRGQTAKIVSSTFFPNCAAQTGGSADVQIANFGFQPQQVSVPAGTTVRWTNYDLDYHTVTFDDGTLNSGNIQQGETYVHTFTQPGTHTYYCIPHPYMTGTLTITLP
jgi:glucose/arabinose dehydrogenase/plastocyanin